MATVVRLRADAERALREQGARTGQSRRELIRAAVDRYLGLEQPAAVEGAADETVTSKLVFPFARPAASSTS